MARCHLIACALAIGLSVLASLGDATGKTIRVPQDYFTIPQAIHAAQPGDEVVIAPGRYEVGTTIIPAIHIHKSITIRGAGAYETILAEWPMSLTEIESKSSIQVVIEDLTLTREERRGLVLSIGGKANVTLNNVRIRGTTLEDYSSDPCIRISGSAKIKVESCEIFTTVYVPSWSTNPSPPISGSFGRGEYGIVMTGTAAELHAVSSKFRGVRVGVRSSGGNRIKIEDCEIDAVNTGIELLGRDVVEITDTTISSGDSGVRAYYPGASLLLEGCGITAREEGIVVPNKEVALKIIGCDITGMVGVAIGTHGVSGEGEPDVEIKGSRIMQCVQGGVVIRSGQLKVTECEISGNTTAGILLEKSARGLLVSNTIRDNDGWGIVARDGAVAVGWGNTVSGNSRDLFGVSPWLKKTKLATDKAIVAVPKDAASIEEAVYRVVEGGTILIDSGDYSDERVGIYKSLTLQGSMKDVLVGGIATFRDIGNIQIRTLNVLGADSGIGILNAEGNELVIEDCDISCWETAFVLLAGSSTSISDSTISKNEVGVDASFSSLDIVGCELSSNESSAIVSSGARLRIDRCTVSLSGDTDNEAIVVGNSTVGVGDCVIRDSIIENNNSSGIYVITVAEVKDSSIQKNKGNGIVSFGDSTIENCLIADNKGDGVFALGGTLAIRNSEIAFNRYGICLDSRGESIKKLIGQDIHIHDNRSGNLHPPLEAYPWPIEFEGVPITDTIPPALVQDLTLTDTERDRTTVCWTNPSDSDLGQVIVRRKFSDCPSDHTNGTLVYQDQSPVPGASVEHVDSDLTSDQAYYYVVFSEDLAGNWNDTVQEGKNADVRITTTVVRNHPPNAPVNITQLLPGKTEIPLGGTVGGDTMLFHAIVTDPDSDVVKLQVELRRLDELGGDFDETRGEFKESDLTSTENEATCYAEGLIPADYHWRARAVDEYGLYSDWVEFGGNPTSKADFTILFVDSQPPRCAIKLRVEGTTTSIDEVDTGAVFEIYAGDSIDEKAIEAVRFSSDASEDGQPTGEWTEWYDWNKSSGDWDSALRVKKWSFATGGQKEVWAEVKDTGDNVSQCSVNISAHPGYAIVVAGQGGWRDKRGLDHCANNAYRALRNLGFDDTHIWYLNSSRPQDIDGDGDDEVDASALLNHFVDTVNEVKGRIGSSPTPLILYFAGHGAPDCFVFDEDNPEQGYLWVSKTATMVGLQELLDEFAIETSMFVVIGSCYSGCFITSSEESSGNISADNRIIITANHDDTTRILWGWARCSDCLWGDLLEGSSVKKAFARRTLSIDKRRLWLDDNGDTIGHPPHALETDGKLAAGTKIGVPGSDNLKLKPWAFYWIRSPGELCLYDAQGQVTGLVNGEVREEIPNSLYDEENKIVALFSPTDSYYCQVVGADEGAYELDATSIENGTATTFTAADIPTIPGAVHRYTIDWNALARGEEGVVLQMDIDGEGTFEKTSQVGAELDGSILAVAEITPPQDGATNTWLWVILGVGVASILTIAVVVSVKWTNWRKSSKGPWGSGT